MIKMCQDVIVAQYKSTYCTQTWLKREAESVLKSSYFQGSSKLKRKWYIYVGQGWILALSEVSFIFINTSKQDKNNYIPLTLFQRFMLLLLFITNKGGDGTCFNLVKLQMISSIFQKLKGVQLVLTAHVHIKGIHNHPSWSLTQIFFSFYDISWVFWHSEYHTSFGYKSAAVDAIKAWRITIKLNRETEREQIRKQATNINYELKFSKPNPINANTHRHRSIRTHLCICYGLMWSPISYIIVSALAIHYPWQQ